MAKFAEAFGKFILSMAVSIALGIYNAWLFKDLWNWFAVPTFAVGEIETAMAYGLLMLLAWPLSYILFCANQTYDKQEGAIGIYGKGFVVSYVHTFIWVIAYVLAHNFI